MAYMETCIVDGVSITDMNPPPEPKRDTYVYIIQTSISGNIKIGIASDVKRRIYGIQTSNHEVIKILHCCKYETLSKAKEMESVLHGWFRDHNVKGEWFKPSTYLLSFIEAFKKDDINSFCKKYMDLGEKWEICNDLIDFAIADYKDGNYNRLRFLKEELIDVIKQINGLLPENKNQIDYD